MDSVWYIRGSVCLLKGAVSCRKRNPERGRGTAEFPNIKPRGRRCVTCRTHTRTLTTHGQSRRATRREAFLHHTRTISHKPHGHGVPPSTPAWYPPAPPLLTPARATAPPPPLTRRAGQKVMPRAAAAWPTGWLRPPRRPSWSPRSLSSCACARPLPWPRLACTRRRLLPPAARLGLGRSWPVPRARRECAAQPACATQAPMHADARRPWVAAQMASSRSSSAA